jgi:hypothetical protein
MKLTRIPTLAATALVALMLTACGLPGNQPSSVIPQATSATADTGALDFTPTEAKKATELNQSGQLGTKDMSEYEQAAGNKAIHLADGYSSQAINIGRHVIQLGYIREVDGGNFVLALNGMAPIPLTGSDGKRDDRIKKLVNHKAIIWGMMLPKGQLMVEHMLGLPNFNCILDLFNKSRLDGTVFLATNQQGLVQALVTVKANTSGFITRTQSDRSGHFSFSGLDPDTYTMTIGLGGFKQTTQTVTLLKGKKSTVQVGMTPGGN